MFGLDVVHTSVKCLSEEYSYPFPSSENEPKIDNLAVVNLRAYPRRAASPLVAMITLSVFPNDTTVSQDMLIT